MVVELIAVWLQKLKIDDAYCCCFGCLVGRLLRIICELKLPRFFVVVVVDDDRSPFRIIFSGLKWRNWKKII